MYVRYPKLPTFLFINLKRLIVNWNKQFKWISNLIRSKIIPTTFWAAFTVVVYNWNKGGNKKIIILSLQIIPMKYRNAQLEEEEVLDWQLADYVYIPTPLNYMGTF